jgi:hypothetical protein
LIVSKGADIGFADPSTIILFDTIDHNPKKENNFKPSFVSCKGKMVHRDI